MRNLFKLLRSILILVLTFAGLLVLIAIFIPQTKIWIEYNGLMGNDTPQFLHYVAYYLKYSHFPINSWDFFWHNGVPRAIDLQWLQFTLASYLAKSIGVFATAKFYPIFALGLGAILTFFVFFELSGSVLIALGLAISFVLGKGYYNALYSGGVVLSTISQLFLPLQIYFLARFAKRGGHKNLFLGSVSSVLGLASHGLMMMFFGFIPAFIFVLFSNRENNALITKKTIVNSILFGASTLLMGAIFVWPSLLLALQGGSTTTFTQHWKYDSKNIQTMLDYNNPGVIYGFVLAVIVAIVFWFFKKSPNRALRPVLITFLVYVFWMITYTVGGNLLFEVLFPGRIFWIWSFGIGALASILLLPLSEYGSADIRGKLSKFLGFGLIKLLIFIVIVSPFIISNHLNTLDGFNKYIQKYSMPKFKSRDLIELSQNTTNNITDIIKPNDNNVRFWSHSQDINNFWIHLSDMPLSEGYAHIWTRRSRLWEGWFYAVLSYPNWESNDIPRDMAKEQSLFFLDWYGVKYMAAAKGQGEWDIAPHFYDSKSPYIERKKILPNTRSLFVIKDEYTSPIISAVNTPIVGFVGSDDAYMTFLKDIAMLNLNTSYLVPVKMSTSLSGVDSSRLKNVDILIIYDFEEGGLPFSNNWGKISDFVKNGGKVWVEGGGNSSIREKVGLAEILPITQTYYESLGKDWESGGSLADKVNFSKLDKLIYNNADWKLSYTTSDKVKQGANVLLTQKGNPIAVSKEVGLGKILWTGANFWYRPEEYRKNGMNEVIFIRLFLNDLLGSLVPRRITAQVERKNPESATVTGRGFSGVVFKENHWPGWQAKVISGGKEASVSVFTAGPELMYIPIPKNMREGDIRVNISYTGWIIYWLFSFISIVSFSFVVLYLMFGKRVLIPLRSLGVGKKTKSRAKSMGRKISGWWEKDEDDI